MDPSLQARLKWYRRCPPVLSVSRSSASGGRTRSRTRRSSWSRRRAGTATSACRLKPSRRAARPPGRDRLGRRAEPPHRLPGAGPERHSALQRRHPRAREPRLLRGERVAPGLLVRPAPAADQEPPHPALAPPPSACRPRGTDSGPTSPTSQHRPPNALARPDDDALQSGRTAEGRAGVTGGEGAAEETWLGLPTFRGVGANGRQRAGGGGRPRALGDHPGRRRRDRHRGGGRRHHRARAPGAGHHAAPRPLKLVVPRLAGAEPVGSAPCSQLATEHVCRYC